VISKTDGKTNFLRSQDCSSMSSYIDTFLLIKQRYKYEIKNVQTDIYFFNFFDSQLEQSLKVLNENLQVNYWHWPLEG
jgi:hypothetical protein